MREAALNHTMSETKQFRCCVVQIFHKVFLITDRLWHKTTFRLLLLSCFVSALKNKKHTCTSM